MKFSRSNHMRVAIAFAGFALTALLAAPSVFAANLTWDTTSGDNPTVTAGIGAWNTTAGNLVWNDNANPNVIWS